MKAIKTGLAVLMLLCGFALTGCSSVPTRLEMKLFRVETNVVEQVVTQTNQVWQTNVQVLTLTNTAQQVVMVTNITPVLTPVVVTFTNYAVAYDYQKGTNAQSVEAIAGAIAAPFGFGDIVKVALGGVFGLWGLWRSSKKAKTAATLAQVIETGRRVLQQTPQGSEAEQAWRNWMISHQSEQGVIQDVVKLLQRNVDSAAAREAAAELVKLMEETQRRQATSVAATSVDTPKIGI